MIAVAEHRKGLAQHLNQLESHEADLHRIDTAFVAAAKAGTRLTSPAKIFVALTDASILCADVIDGYGAKPIPANVRAGLLQLHCAMSDLATSLKVYGALSVSKKN
jgi:hypothetical protein